MSNPPGAHRELTQEPPRRRVIPGNLCRWQSRWRSYEELLLSPGNDHPSPSDPSRARVGIGLARPARSTSGTRRRARARHSIHRAINPPCFLKNKQARLRDRNAKWRAVPPTADECRDRSGVTILSPSRIELPDC